MLAAISRTCVHVPPGISANASADPSSAGRATRGSARTLVWRRAATSLAIPRIGGIWMNLGLVPQCKASRSPRASGQRRCVAGTAPRGERFHDSVKQRSACGYAQHGGRGGQSEEYCVAEQESG